MLCSVFRHHSFLNVTAPRSASWFTDLDLRLYIGEIDQLWCIRELSFLEIHKVEHRIRLAVRITHHNTAIYGKHTASNEHIDLDRRYNCTVVCRNEDEFEAHFFFPVDATCIHCFLQLN